MLYTPQEFAAAMEELRDKHADDPEVCHAAMDDLMCELLRELDYEEGIDIYEETHKYYA